MKKECAQTMKALRRYLRGHVFTAERRRIERHLAVCPLCATQLQSLKRSDETTQFLKDITPPEGIADRARRGVSGLASAKKILYRPAWIVAGAAFVYVLVRFVVTPYLAEQEREWRELSAPSKTAQPAPPSSAPAAAAPAAPAPKKPPEPAPAATKQDTLVVTITTEDERMAIRRINDALRGHGALRTKRFSETVKEISGELTPHELQTLFSRIEDVGRLSYSRRRLEAAPDAQPLPFVLKLRAAPKPAAPKGEAAPPVAAPEASKPAAERAQQPAATAAPNAPAQEQPPRAQ